MYLIDTNIFLSIILQEDSSKECEKLILKESGNIVISDFAIHTIGVKLLGRKEKHVGVFKKFIEKILHVAKVQTFESVEDYGG